MTDLDMIGYTNVHPQIDRLSYVDVDIHLSRALDEFDVEAASRANIQEHLVVGASYLTISVPAENFKINVLALDELLRQISTDAAALRVLAQSALDRVEEQAKEIKWI